MTAPATVCTSCEVEAGYIDMFGDLWCLTHWLELTPSKLDGQWLCWRCGQPAREFFGGQVTKLPGDPDPLMRMVSAYLGRRPYKVVGGVCLSCWELAHGPWEAS